ncbi:hypothetical protein P153DRAFT_338774 [Dothidotthia symphoricarpi CBS 119687]|uniref:Methyltransferase domain-containing protein n=1 Tax=Dothidotthia symphoricarpi CBS 119687 TaxID=1392245 RepID=A0A6A6AFL1_9PLEO|nr:uncharacterized protein P153DRAFT_338774 [Dothidotthia symphoricarpi CBS 119687]KAF2129734.1 hypothetical protein P153DRAFT_338774 [Dothidotthia symphoricarpi CBS 119687]
MIRSFTARVITVVIVAIFVIAIFNNEQTALLPYLPLSQSYSPSKPVSYPPSWLKDRMALSEKSWEKSVEQREKMAASHPSNPKVPFFPTDFLKYPFTIWDFFPATWTCPHDFQRVGRMGDGGKWVCGMNLYENLSVPKIPAQAAVESREPEAALSTQQEQGGLVVYSFGINGESSFEAEMLDRVPSARFWGYDFSVEGWGPQIPEAHRHRTFFKKAGIGAEDKEATEKLPPFYTIDTLMKQNKHTYIDILKIDIEGSEYDALDVFMDSLDAKGQKVIPIGQVMIELHLDNGDPGDKVDFERFRNWWERLEKMGMRPTWMEINLFAVTLGSQKSNPRCTEFVWVNARDQRNVLWSGQ